MVLFNINNCLVNFKLLMLKKLCCCDNYDRIIASDNSSRGQGLIFKIHITLQSQIYINSRQYIKVNHLCSTAAFARNEPLCRA